MAITDPLAAPPPGPPNYVLARWLFLRLLGVIYLIAFVSLAVQITGLVGEHGILPARLFLERARDLYGGAASRVFPTLCWLGAGEGMPRGRSPGGAVLVPLPRPRRARVARRLPFWRSSLSRSAAWR